MHIIDTHCDTIMCCYLDKVSSLGRNSLQIDIEKLKRGGSLAQFFAIFLLTHKDAEEEGITLAPYDLFNDMYKIYEIEMEKNKSYISHAFSAADILQNSGEGKISAVLTIEDGVFAENDLGRLEDVFHKGVRLITLTWNYENSIGYPCSDHEGEHMRGLKPFGIEAVGEMNRLGIIVDVSHLSEGGFFDVAKHSTKPFMASHSCARALCDHRRNLTDAQLRCLGEKGGVVGMNLNPCFVVKDSEHSRIDDIAGHICYMADKAGVEAIALGSDFDGLDGTTEIAAFDQYDRLLHKLNKTLSQDMLDKLCNGNVLRIMKECIGK